MRLLSCLLLLAAPLVYAQAPPSPIEIKVVVINMFEQGADTGDVPGEYQFWVDRPMARFGAWYEFFPRSTGGRDATGRPMHGTFATAAKELERVAAMGFDVAYLPPIHPIGYVNRKGPNNTLGAGPTDVGSPWAIGSPEGGHDAVHPDLGTLDDFDHFVAAARENGLEVALDYALRDRVAVGPVVHQVPRAVGDLARALRPAVLGAPARPGTRPPRRAATAPHQRDGAADAGAGRHQDTGDPDLLRHPAGMHGTAAAEGDQSAALIGLAGLDGMDAGRIGHILIDHFDNTERGHFRGQGQLGAGLEPRSRIVTSPQFDVHHTTDQTAIDSRYSPPRLIRR